MKRTAAEMENAIFALLKEWCDRLLDYQLDFPADPSLDGGILCPACHVIHGRCSDAIYPLLMLADRTGEEKYRLAAEKLFTWETSLLCDDGSYYNDAQSTWNGITVFRSISLADALIRHGAVLSDAFRSRFESRLLLIGEWLLKNITPNTPININYSAANALAMTLLGKYYNKEEFRTMGRALAHNALKHFSENDLLYGESHASQARSPKGCPSIDVGGYNVEESLPCLLRYAELTGDQAVLEKVKAAFRAQLEFMLPDGAWDNSLGSRNFKWTYWGSRTSDGALRALFALGRNDSVFAEAAWRNFELIRSCTHEGLLYGGPDYYRHGERPCTHHTFCHAKVLAEILDEGLYDFEPASLPLEAPARIRYYPELDSYRIAAGPWLANITAYDYEYLKGGHASGGSLALLWHQQYGPVVAVGAVDYSLHENHNQQLTLKKAEHRSLCPRIERVDENGVRLGQHYDYSAQLQGADHGDFIQVRADAHLCLPDQQRSGSNDACHLDYLLKPEGLTITGFTAPALCDSLRFVLPILSDQVQIRLQAGREIEPPKPVFDLDPGFMGTEYTFAPDASGRFCVQIR